MRIRRKVSYKSKKVIDNPKDNWIVVENTHESIIDKQTFEKVQLMIELKGKKNVTRRDRNVKKI